MRQAVRGFRDAEIAVLRVGAQTVGLEILFTVMADRDALFRPDFPDRQIPGLSKGVGDLTVYYEKAGFSTRISRRYRSPFRAETLGPHGDRIATEIRAEGIVDFQAGYEFQQGRAKGLSLLLQLDNIGDAPYRTRLVGGFGVNLDAPETFNTYGRQVLFGVNYKL